MQKLAEEILQLPNRKIKSIIGNPQKSAEAVNLIYIHDNEQGIRRIKEGKHFNYITER